MKVTTKKTLLSKHLQRTYIDDLITIDTIDKVKDDEAFLVGLIERCASKTLADKTRVWVSHEEIRRLRILANYKASSEWLRSRKNRRMRLNTVRMYISRAMAGVEQRAAHLVTNALGAAPDLTDVDFADIELRVAQRIPVMKIPPFGFNNIP